MLNRFAFKTVEQRDLVKNIPYLDDMIFGGKVFVLGRYFRQILPVVSKGSCELTVASSLSSIFKN